MTLFITGKNTTDHKQLLFTNMKYINQKLFLHRFPPKRGPNVQTRPAE